MMSDSCKGSLLPGRRSSALAEVLPPGGMMAVAGASASLVVYERGGVHVMCYTTTLSTVMCIHDCTSNTVATHHTHRKGC